MRRKIRIPSTSEDEEITKAALADPDCPPQTDEELAQFRPITPELLERIRSLRRRGPQKKPVKVQVSIRLEAGVVDWFRATGAGWQTRLGQVLRDYVAARRG
jgi:uncharacterized protein (DUF4415 family)